MTADRPERAPEGLSAEELTEWQRLADGSHDTRTEHAMADAIDALIGEVERLRVERDEAIAALEAGDACGAVGCRAFSELERLRGVVARVEALAEELEAAEIADLRDHHAGDLRDALSGTTPAPRTPAEQLLHDIFGKRDEAADD